MLKQVSKDHYAFAKYFHKPRWLSLWHQIDEIVKLNPGSVLEIGPGPGIFQAIADTLGVRVETLDLDPELNPNHLGSVLEMPFSDNSFDIVCAFQMLEHLPYDKALEAFAEMARVAKNKIIISLPDAAIRYSFSVQLPKFGRINFSIPKPSFRASTHKFDGQHYWEINKAGYPVSKIVNDLTSSNSIALSYTYRVPEFQYHRFFVFDLNK